MNGEKSGEHAVEALSNIRSFALFSIIGYLLLGLGLIMFFPSTIMKMMLHRRGIWLSGITILAFPYASLILIVGGILLLISIYLYLLKGMDELEKYSAEYSSPHSLIKIGYVLGIILIIIGIPTLIILIGGLLMIIGGILMLLGKIGLIIALIRMDGNFKEGLFTASAILYIIGIFMPILDFISAIILYAACNGALKKIEKTGINV